MTITDRTTESADVFGAELARWEAAPAVDIAADVREALREQVLDAMSWAETFDEGRIGRAGAERLLGEYEAALSAMPPADETLRERAAKAYAEGRWCGECQYGEVADPPCCLTYNTAGGVR